MWLSLKVVARADVLVDQSLRVDEIAELERVFKVACTAQGVLCDITLTARVAC